MDDNLDDSDADDINDVMIALLPISSDWCKIDLPHMTLVYAGEVADMKPGDFNDIAKDTSMLGLLSSNLYLKVTGVEVFGDTEKVDVLTVQPSPELLAMRRAVEEWNGSKFPFKPHATIGPVGTSRFITVPSYLVFNRLMVAWGNDSLIFPLKGSMG